MKCTILKVPKLKIAITFKDRTFLNNSEMLTLYTAYATDCINFLKQKNLKSFPHIPSHLSLKINLIVPGGKHYGFPIYHSVKLPFS
jgi:hypothetical protein